MPKLMLKRLINNYLLTAHLNFDFLIIFYVALGSFTYGFSASVIGSLFGLPSFFEYFKSELTGPNSKYGTRITGSRLLIFPMSLATELM